jgi:hypothetical protein
MSAGARISIVRLAFAALAWLPGCAAFEGLVNPAGRLLEQTHQAVEQKDFDTAYRHLAEIRKQHPDSAESREAFPIAAGIFKWKYSRSRYSQPDSPWVTSEPGFMLDWFAGFLSGRDFPQGEAEALFVGMPYGYFRDYLALAETRPELSRWAIRAEDGNGIIEVIEAEGAF